MKKALGILCGFFVFVLLAACVSSAGAGENGEIPADASQSRKNSPDTSRYRYYFDISTNTAGFTLIVNGVELVYFEGGKSYSKSLDINDWMLFGDNEFEISIFWPDDARYTPGKASGVFTLSMEETKSGGDTKTSELYALQWPGSLTENYPFSVTETFKPKQFPHVLIEKAERITGVLPRSDQEEITAVVEQLRQAFAAKDPALIDELLFIKYADIAGARFVRLDAYKAEVNSFYTSLFEREAFTVRPLYSRYNFQSTAADRLVKVMQGSIGFPEPALVMTYRENRRTLRYDLDLYFAKIDGRWIIVR
jgi:hypothetical protein